MPAPKSERASTGGVASPYMGAKRRRHASSLAVEGSPPGEARSSSRCQPYAFHRYGSVQRPFPLRSALAVSPLRHTPLRTLACQQGGSAREGGGWRGDAQPHPHEVKRWRRRLAPPPRRWGRAAPGVCTAHGFQAGSGWAGAGVTTRREAKRWRSAMKPDGHSCSGPLLVVLPEGDLSPRS